MKSIAAGPLSSNIRGGGVVCSYRIARLPEENEALAAEIAKLRADAAEASHAGADKVYSHLREKLKGNN